MDIRQVSERIRDHLTQQKARSVASASGDCKYRGPAGTTCAVGCLIGNEHYSEIFEGQRISDNRIQKAVEKSLGITVDPLLYDILEDWQWYHDCDSLNLKYYREWLFDTPEALSPEDFHQQMMEKVEKYESRTSR